VDLNTQIALMKALSNSEEQPYKDVVGYLGSNVELACVQV
jgi:hypothetical protein